MKSKVLTLTFLALGIALQLQGAPANADGTSADTQSASIQQVSTEPNAATWKAWHKVLADELFHRIKDILVKIGPPETEREFYCKVHWRINPDGRVILLKIDGPQSHLFRDVVRAAVDSMKSSTNLKFPEGSTKPYVQKISEVKFWWNPSTGAYDLFEPENQAN